MSSGKTKCTADLVPLLLSSCGHVHRSSRSPIYFYSIEMFLYYFSVHNISHPHSRSGKSHGVFQNTANKNTANKNTKSNTAKLKPPFPLSSFWTIYLPLPVQPHIYPPFSHLSRNFLPITLLRHVHREANNERKAK